MLNFKILAKLFNNNKKASNLSFSKIEEFLISSINKIFVFTIFQYELTERLERFTIHKY